MSVRIILETILGILLLAGVGAVIIAFAFKEQWRRLIKYIQLWQADDSRREAIQRRLDNEMRERLANEELQASLAREKAEAEIEKTL
jgi:superfamily I DNA and RNA helicase